MNGLHDVVEQPSAAAAMHQPGCREQALVFSCGGQLLLGILTPAPATARLGMVVVVGGPQYRVGSHRQFVQLARHMAAAGFPTLRFDVRGMGDSPGATPSFEALHNDIEAAVDALVAYEPSLQGVLLFGLCDGASAALMYIGSRRDPRVVGLCLLNPWVRSVESQARAQVRHYYLDRLRQPAFWRKLLSGRLALRAGLELVATLRRAAKPGHLDAQSGADATFQDRMFEGLNRFDRPVLLGLSADDHTAREFEQYCKDRAHWQTLLARPAIRRVLFAGADHTFSRPGNMKELLICCEQWCLALQGGAR